MKKLVVTFGIIIILINLMISHTILRRIETTFNYRVITANMLDDRGSNALYISEIQWSGIWSSSARYSDNYWVNIDSTRAVRIAHMLILDGDRVDQPYLVYHDEENEVFIVIANFANHWDNQEGTRRVIVCQRTGGILLNTVRIVQ
jgi:hypothetical protein